MAEFENSPVLLLIEVFEDGALLACLDNRAGLPRGVRAGERARTEGTVLEFDAIGFRAEDGETNEG